MRMFYDTNDLDRSMDSTMSPEEWAEYVEKCRDQVRTAERQLLATTSLIDMDARIYAAAVHWLSVVEIGHARYGDPTARAKGDRG